MMISMRRIVPLTLLVLAGCGTEEDRIDLVPVSGTITQNGKPMAGATVSFIPDAANPVSTPGVDSTGPEGNYKIMFKHRSGLAPGKYRVVVEPGLEAPGGGKVPEEFADDPYMAQMSLGVIPGEKKQGEAAGTKNEFEAEVTDGEDNVFEFDVKTTSR